MIVGLQVVIVIVFVPGAWFGLGCLRGLWLR